MNRILNLQAILPPIDLPGADVLDSNASYSCTSGCNSQTSAGCQGQTTVAGGTAFF